MRHLVFFSGRAQKCTSKNVPGETKKSLGRAVILDVLHQNDIDRKKSRFSVRYTFTFRSNHDRKAGTARHALDQFVCRRNGRWADTGTLCVAGRLVCLFHR